MPIGGILDGLTSMLARVAPGDVIKIFQDQMLKIAHDQNGGLLTLGMLGTIWSMSSGMDAIISTLNQAYDIQEGRSWWIEHASPYGKDPGEKKVGEKKKLGALRSLLIPRPPSDPGDGLDSGRSLSGRGGPA